MPASNKIITLLLAAGESARMGRPKQLLTYKNKTLLQHAVETALSITPVTIVLGANHEAHLQAIKQFPAQHIINQNWQSGMGSSLKAGLTHCIENNAELEAVIVMVCDQPLITRRHLEDLITQHHATTRTIIATEYAQTRGVPALFKRDIFSQLLAIDNSQGAKKIIAQNHNNAISICFQDGAIDLDTEQDYQSFLNIYNK
jgi:molybdenum cofactor cytidylyltransferase